ncbi:uncharacterized protein MIR9-1HG isoform X3 [Rhinolophus ferrumequinum]|uniref:uncharacterized protein MIR9-1HG isoform X3 n=1 Tax=Rhinolophus ferrumequinum TaxID=59479 RepID=UPI00140FDF66|nr:uncharacterized protein MIR9-1HG isoform X3 [Rhinolophus ferrumequinum]
MSSSRESSKRKREASEIPEWRDRCYVIAIGAASSLHRRQKPSEAVRRRSRLFTEARSWASEEAAVCFWHHRSGHLWLLGSHPGVGGRVAASAPSRPPSSTRASEPLPAPRTAPSDPKSGRGVTSVTQLELPQSCFCLPGEVLPDV